MPSIEATYRSGSLLEMAKELECVFSYLDFTEALIDCPTLFELLLEIDPKYKPSQRDPVYKLIKHLTGLSDTLLKCLPDLDSDELTEEQKEQNRKPKLLAERLIKTNKILEEKIKETVKSKDTKLALEDILAMGVPQAY